MSARTPTREDALQSLRFALVRVAWIKTLAEALPVIAEDLLDRRQTHTHPSHPYPHPIGRTHAW